MSEDKHYHFSAAPHSQEQGSLCIKKKKLVFAASVTLSAACQTVCFFYFVFLVARKLQVHLCMT